MDTLFTLAHTVAAHYGKSCETAVYAQNNDAEYTVVCIENGEVTGRAVGDSAPERIRGMFGENPPAGDKTGYFDKTADGKILKSSAACIRDENGRVIAVFTINHDITALSVASGALSELVNPPGGSGKQNHTPDVSELLDELLWKSTELIGKPVALMNKDDKMRAVRYLNSKGALLITKSGDKIAEYFGISKFTLYSYIDDKQGK